MSEPAGPLSTGETTLILGELADAAPDSPFISMSGPEATPFTLGQDNFRPAERLTGLERMGEKLARSLKPVMESFARARLQVTPLPIAIRPYDEWQDSLPEFISISHYRLRPLKGGAMLVAVEANFVAGLVECFFGGSGGPRPHRGGDFTPSEDLLLQRLLERVVGTLTDHWREVTPIEATLVTRETGTMHIGFIRGDDTAVIQSFQVQWGAATTTITVVYPLAMLRPIEERLSARIHNDEGESSDAWRDRLGEALRHVRLPVRSVLARPQITVAQLLALKVGDVIPITLTQRTPLLAGARRIAEGTIGEQEGRAALMIEKVGQAE
jgi:flagellar motor switch protein FliM